MSLQIFSPYPWLVFSFLDSVFWVKQKFFILMKSRLSINSFIDFACGVFIQKVIVISKIN